MTSFTCEVQKEKKRNTIIQHFRRITCLYNIYTLSLCFFLVFLYFIIPLPSSGDCSPVSGPTTWLMFATPVRGLELSEIWGLFKNILSNRLNALNNLVELDWLNLAFTTFKLKMKKLFLTSG